MKIHVHRCEGGHWTISQAEDDIQVPAYIECPYSGCKKKKAVLCTDFLPRNLRPEWEWKPSEKSAFGKRDQYAGLTLTPLR